MDDLARKQRARAFDDLAAGYDRFRPPFPPEMYDFIWSKCGLDEHAVVVEVGSGTGIGTAGLADRGARVTCVEPGERLITQARQRLGDRDDVGWVVTGFEQWDGPEEPVDLVFAGNVWHWLESGERSAKAARVLEPGGWLALAWHQARNLTGPMANDIAAGYERWAPEVARAVLAEPTPFHAGTVAELTDSTEFELTDAVTFELVRDLSADDYIGLLGTYSDHAMLPDVPRTGLFEHVRGAINDHGGTLTKVDDVLLFLARRA